MRGAIAAVLLVGCTTTGPKSLFDGRDLDGWYSWLPNEGRDNDPLGFFRVEDGMIHVLGVDLALGQFEFGYLATIDEYETFRVRFEYKWGPRNFVGWGPDSGFFVAAVGDDKIWPRSLECQVNANDTGSMYVFDYATLETTVDASLSAPTYYELGQPYKTPRNAEPNYARVTHDAAYDSLTDWNQVEVVVSADGYEFVVNGHTTFRGASLKQPKEGSEDDPTADIPIRKGRLVIQEEGAEVWYRNIELEPL